jgi:hypothetical protein
VRQRTGATRLGDDLLRGGDADAGDLIQLRHLGGERGDRFFDPGGERIDLGGERVGAVEHHAQQERVVVGEVPGQRLLQDAHLGAHLLAGEVGERARVALPSNERSEHVPPGGPEDVADHTGQFHLGVFQQFLGALLLPGPLLDQGAAVAGQVPQLPLRPAGDEAGPEHAALGELAQPDRVDLVGFGPARDVLDVAGVDHPALDVVFEQVERRLPVCAGGLHHHPGDPLADQPVPQLQQRRGHRRAGADLLAARSWPGLVRHPHARRQRRLADIERRDPFHQLGRLIGDFLHDMVLSVRADSRRLPAEAQGGVQRRNRVLRATMQDPCGRLPASRLLCGLSRHQASPASAGNHPRFSRLQGVTAATSTTPMFVNPEVFSVFLA